MSKQFSLALLFTSMFFTGTLLAGEKFSELFPLKGFEDRVEFWKLIFTRFGQNDFVFHDKDDLSLTYHVLHFERDSSTTRVQTRKQRDQLRQRKRELEQHFNSIIRRGADPNELNPEQLKIVQIIENKGYDLSPTVLRHLRNNIRVQRGIREKFRSGLVRSGRHLQKIQRILRQHKLPVELSFLPHVESSFDYSAYSKRGAAGIWQFMRGTGRRFLRINRYVDERLDLLKATEAAALLMKENFQVLEAWPLAITAFNHGQNGMRRAKKQFGKDLTNIVDHYKSRIFGFASKNFYAEFLAAVEIAQNPSQYFEGLEIDLPLPMDTVVLKRPYHLELLTRLPELSLAKIQAYNPHIRGPVWRKSGVLRQGTRINMPQGLGPAVAEALENAQPAQGPITVATDGATYYEVQYGDNLAFIARQFGLTVKAVQRKNNIRNPNRIYEGRLLLVSGPTANPPPTDPASEQPSKYRVKPGDTLDRISRRFGASVKNLQSANKITNPHKIYLGQILLIP